MTVETKAPPPPMRLAGRVALVLLVAAGVVLAWLYRDALDAPAIAATIRGYRLAPLWFVAAHLVASLIFFPRTVLAVAAGAVFGVVMGTVWATLGSTAGAVLGFMLARYVNSSLVDIESTRRFGPILLWAERGGWLSVAVLRLVPVIPHSLSNYALGLTRVGLGAYVAGTVLGQLPMTIASVAIGSAGAAAAATGDWLWPTVIGVAALAMAVMGQRLLSRRPSLAPPSLPSPSRGRGKSD
jgi:uncharacterized membrane protein YdjX (TVP38/TMEM64 family)